MGSYIETFAQIRHQDKMAKISLLFVGKLGNSWLLPAFPASIRLIFPHFPFVAALCKGLILFKCFLYFNKTTIVVVVQSLFIKIIIN
jgi:hypothetical protein